MKLLAENYGETWAKSFYQTDGEISEYQLAREKERMALRLWDENNGDENEDFQGTGDPGDYELSILIHSSNQVVISIHLHRRAAR